MSANGLLCLKFGPGSLDEMFAPVPVGFMLIERHLIFSICISFTNSLSNSNFQQNPQENPYHLIMRASHVIKGAAANLMCNQLRQSALQLEQAAKQAHEAGGTAAPAELQSAVQTQYNNLSQAAQNYTAFLQSIGV